MQKTIQINIRLDEGLHSALRARAEDEVTNVSQLVRKAVTYYLRPTTLETAPEIEDKVACLKG